MLPPSLSSPSVHHRIGASRQCTAKDDGLKHGNRHFVAKITNRRFILLTHKKQPHEECGRSKVHYVAISQRGCRVPRCRRWSTRGKKCWRSHTRLRCGIHPLPSCRNLGSKDRIPPELLPVRLPARPYGPQRFQCGRRKTAWRGWIPTHG